MRVCFIYSANVLNRTLPSYLIGDKNKLTHRKINKVLALGTIIKISNP